MESKISQKSNRREQRKEKSRNAARCRRKNESESYQSLIKLLPIDNDILANIDQGTGLCLVNRFMQLRSNLPKCIKEGRGWNYADESLDAIRNYSSIDDDLLKAGNGFMLIVDYQCKTLFVSQNTREHLGVNETDIVGHDLRSLIHEGDHDQVLDFFSKTHVTDKENGDNSRRLFCRVRTSFEVARTGRSKFKSGTGRYQTFNCTFIQFEETETKSEQLYGVFVQAMPPPTPALTIGVSSSCFLTHHSLDFKFICDDNDDDDEDDVDDETELSQTIGYDKKDLVGRSFFEYCHPLDISTASHTLANMTKWRQVEFGPYRFLCKRGGWVNLLTQASRVSGNKNGADTIVCLHYISGSVRHAEVLMTSKQIDDSCCDSVGDSSAELRSIDHEISSLFVTAPPPRRDDRGDADEPAPTNDKLDDIYGDSSSVEADSRESAHDKYLWPSVIECDALSMVNNNKTETNNNNQQQETLFSGRHYDHVMGDNDPHLISTAASSPGMAGGKHAVIGSLESVDPYLIPLTLEEQNDDNEEYMAVTTPIEMFFEECEVLKLTNSIICTAKASTYTNDELRDTSESEPVFTKPPGKHDPSICYSAPSIGDPWVWNFGGENKTTAIQDQPDCMLFPEAQVDTTAASSNYYQMKQQHQQQLGAVPQNIQHEVAALRKESNDSGFSSPSSSPSSNNGSNISVSASPDRTALDVSQHTGMELTPQQQQQQPYPVATGENVNISGNLQMPPQYVMYGCDTGQTEPSRNLKRHANAVFPSTVAMKMARVPTLNVMNSTMRELHVPDIVPGSYATYMSEGDNRLAYSLNDQQQLIIQAPSATKEMCRVRANHPVSHQWQQGRLCTNIANNCNRNAIENLNCSTMAVPDLSGGTALHDFQDLFYYQQSYMNKMQPPPQEQQSSSTPQQQQYIRFREMSKHEIDISPPYPPGGSLVDGGPPLPVLSLNDCEVNAPCTSQRLLVGPIDQLLDD